MAMALQETFGQVDIPEHDAITRRKQFRAKKDRAEARRQKKAEKKAEKKGEKKGDKKVDKKGDNEQETESKAEQKTRKKEGKKDKGSLKPDEEQNQGQEQKKRFKEDTHPGVSADGVVEEPLKKKKGHDVEPGYQKKTRGKGLKRLRRVNSFHKKHEPEVEGVAAAIGEKKSKKKKKSKATREETDEKDESNSEAKNKRKAKVKEEENRSRKVAKRTSNVEAPVDDKVKKMVIDILQECRKTHCCHPSFQAYNFNKKVFQVSVYWNRAAVGVKLHKSKISDYKGKGAFAQIAYLGCQSNCTYSNLALAHLYASCFQKVYAIPNT